jgi:hypothetical protein
MRIGALFAQPFMPVKANEMLRILGVHPKRRSLRDAYWGVDTSYGRINQKKRPVPYVFPKQKDEEAPKGEPMQELMKRRRAEKIALKEKLRQIRHEKAQGEFSRVVERELP